MVLMRSLLGIGLALIVIGCALIVAKESRYLQSAQDRATQEEVKLQLGAPKLTTTTPAGESLWVYEVREIDQGGQTTGASAGPGCGEYRPRCDGRAGLGRGHSKPYFNSGAW